jgi:hypothetical protein
VIKVGAATEVELKEQKHRIEGALSTTICAVICVIRAFSRRGRPMTIPRATSRGAGALSKPSKMTSMGSRRKTNAGAPGQWVT